MINKYLVSVTEAAQLFGIGRDAMYRLVKMNPEVPVVKIGEITKINVPLMEDWLNKVTREGRKLWYKKMA